MKTYIYAHNPKSESAKALANAIGAKRIKHEGSTFRAGGGREVINWGATKLPDEVNLCATVYNRDVSLVVNKLKFFDHMKDSGLCPEHTTDKEVAKTWFVRDNSLVVERHVLNGHSGAGIVLAKKALDLGDAKLYTKYIPKRDEFRVHVAFDNIIDVQQKKIKGDHQGNVNHQIRNLAGGYIYAREDIEVPDCVLRAATQAIALCGLDFGAVDIIYNAHADRAYVLEINTAPGLTGTTLDNYAKAFRA